MSKPLSCWRCRVVAPMLDEAAWAHAGLGGERFLRLMAQLKLERSLTVSASRVAAEEEILHRYRTLTGFDETNADALWHHRISLFGPPCTRCGKPLRTPRAKHCAECGAWRSAPPA